MGYRRFLRTILLTIFGVGMCALTACGADGLQHGANFGYPKEPPVPPGAAVTAKARGQDDDDPMRAREVVFDVGNSLPTEVVNFYRSQFPAGAGWIKGTADPDVGGGHLLCLVRQVDKRFDEYVEIYRDHPSSRPSDAHRYLVSISRLYVSPNSGKRTSDRCGVSATWFPAGG